MTKVYFAVPESWQAYTASDGTTYMKRNETQLAVDAGSVAHQELLTRSDVSLIGEELVPESSFDLADSTEFAIPPPPVDRVPPSIDLADLTEPNVNS
jgi:hypothetical protein